MIELTEACFIWFCVSPSEIHNLSRLLLVKEQNSGLLQFPVFLTAILEDSQ